MVGMIGKVDTQPGNQYQQFSARSIDLFRLELLFSIGLLTTCGNLLYSGNQPTIGLVLMSAYESPAVELPLCCWAFFVPAFDQAWMNQCFPESKAVH